MLSDLWVVDLSLVMRYQREREKKNFLLLFILFHFFPDQITFGKRKESDYKVSGNTIQLQYNRLIDSIFLFFPLLSRAATGVA